MFHLVKTISINFVLLVYAKADIRSFNFKLSTLFVLGYGPGDVKLRALEGRIVELHTSKQQLEQEREGLSRRINEDSETINKLRMRSKELAQDVFMLKNLVMRFVGLICYSFIINFQPILE